MKNCFLHTILEFRNTLSLALGPGAGGGRPKAKKKSVDKVMVENFIDCSPNADIIIGSKPKNSDILSAS